MTIATVGDEYCKAHFAVYVKTIMPNIRYRYFRLFTIHVVVAFIGADAGRNPLTEPTITA